jgi:hypothetical protein
MEDTMTKPDRSWVRPLEVLVAVEGVHTVAACVGAQPRTVRAWRSGRSRPPAPTVRALVAWALVAEHLDLTALVRGEVVERRHD